MNFELSDDQRMMQESFARFLDEQSSSERVRAAAEKDGFDADMWAGLGELGAFCLRIPEEQGGLGLGIMDAVVLMEEVGRTIASGPVAETLISTRLLACLAAEAQAELLEQVMMGGAVATIALHDVAEQPVQWVAGGAVAQAVIAKKGDQVLLVTLPEGERFEANLASTPIAELNLDAADAVVIGEGAEAVKLFDQGIEEWKLLMAAALAGLSRRSVEMAAEYACERVAFDKPIGTYQAISHPLADLITEVDGGKYFTWKAIHDVAKGIEDAGAQISMALYWNADVAARAVTQSLHTFGGYGLATEYDIHLYNLRAKAWPLVWGDINLLLEEAGRRLYAGEVVALPEVGEVGIDFDLGDEARAMAKELDDLFNEILTPELRAKAHYSFDGFDRGVHKKLAEHNFLFPDWREELGGRNVEPYTKSALSAVWEKHGWTSHPVGTSMLVGTMIDKCGTPELKEEVLTKIVSGDAICSLGYSEPGCGSDVFAAKTKATQLEDGSWRIDGAKMWTSGANIADYVIMLTRTDPNVAKHKGLTMFIVPLNTPGIEVHPVFTFQDERTNATFYDGVIVPDTYRLGEVNGGLRVMAAALELEHGGGFMKAQHTLYKDAEEMCREITFAGKPLIERADAQKRLARARMNTYVAEMLGHRCLWVGVTGRESKAYGPMTKMFSSEKFQESARDLLDLTAPYSLSKRHGPAGELNLAYRHAHGTTIYGGTSEVHRSMIAERALGLPRTR
ncbi:acyl-CoA dehydrogenase family protein [Pseudomaricurvus sp. HS19]|uniref:acyl-CoA dehydrogenase family protein n=1 Tax=Pseudomaricurvus sp. HS19 TaxID=2692626 RepID=UPI001370DC85|nr:acyl-CoA dehydrogenase [Pseudomaricurvus sp. HS19]MYM63872.1 acyl-CoA dehydrogenase [Pseudomaricurvus sp. HS19]